MKYVLLDLDGTLTASDEGIIKSVQYALEHFGIIENDYEKLKVFIGPPLREGFPKYSKLNQEQTEEAIKLYRERYSVKGLYENRLYDGVKDMLSACKDKGYELVLATSKPRIYAHKIIEHFDIAKYFTYVVGCELDGTLDSKKEIIEYAMKKCAGADKNDYIMVGDRFYDAEGAKAMGIRSIGVLYGYGSEEELVNAGSTYICKTVEELKKLLLNLD